MEDSKKHCLEHAEELITRCNGDQTMYGYAKGFAMGLFYADVISYEEGEALQARIDAAQRKSYR